MHRTVINNFAGQLTLWRTFPISLWIPLAHAVRRRGPKEGRRGGLALTVGCGRAYCPVALRDPNLVTDAGIRISKLIGIGEDFELEASARTVLST